MITLHRLGHHEHELSINPDLIVTIDANPDTVITLANNTKLVVSETPADVAQAVRDYRVDVLSAALRMRRESEIEAPAAASSARPVPLRLARPEDAR